MREPRYVPVPLRNIFCGLPPPLSLMLTAAERAPLAVGLKVTVAVQLAPGAKVDPQVWFRPKSPLLAPVTVTLVIFSVVVPVFVMVDVIGALVMPTFTFPKFRLAG
jgi:protein involved in polysaccharide export with SLBB domain